MNLDDLIRAIHDNGDRLGAITEERESQYKEIFADDVLSTALDEFTSHEWRETGDKYFSSIRQRISQTNPQYSDAWKDVEILTLVAHEDKTSVHSLDDSSVIVVDSLMMTFLWTMNKAHYYGRRLNRGEQLKLFVELILHFATLKHFGRKGPVWPRPKTPPHERQEELSALFLLTNIQESFMVAHEMAHLVCDRMNPMIDFVCKREYATPYTMISAPDQKIDQELMADELAVDMVLNTIPEEMALQEVVLASIFLLIRYRLWLAFASKTVERDYEFTLWFARNSLFRAKAREAYKGSAATFLIDLLDELELTLEPAALRAGEAFKLILTEKTD